MSLKSEKSVGKVFNSSINTISVSEYSCLHRVSHFTNLLSKNTRDRPFLTSVMTSYMDSKFFP
jgi:hypothetical protein